VLAANPAVRERFEAKVTRPSTGEGCWFWLGGLADTGYGQFAVTTSEVYGAHRLVLAAELGRPLWPNEWALHRCDERSCVRPDHLRVGDAAVNKDDALRGGRSAGPGTTADIRGPGGRARALAAALRAAGQTRIYEPTLAARVLAEGEPLRLFEPPPAAAGANMAVMSQGVGIPGLEVGTR
jgi:hypothetical protein